MAGSMFEAAWRLCDDCGEEKPDLAWYGQHIRICPACREARERFRAALSQGGRGDG